MSSLDPPLPRNYLKAVAFMEVAKIIGTLSTCSRKDVGAVLIRDGRCISWGFNGTPPGLPHCEHDPAISRPCLDAVHAEANAVAFAARQGISTEGSEMYVTVSPCLDCAQLLIAAGVTRVVFNERYRDDAGIQLLRKAGVTVVD